MELRALAYEEWIEDAIVESGVVMVRGLHACERALMCRICQACVTIVAKIPAQSNIVYHSH